MKVVKEDEFDAQVAKGVVLVDFYADWCGPCRMLTPVLEELDKEMGGKISIFKINTDEALNLATRFEVTSIPTLILFKNGILVERVVGLRDLAGLKKMVTTAL